MSSYVPYFKNYGITEGEMVSLDTFVNTVKSASKSYLEHEGTPNIPAISHEDIKRTTGKGQNTRSFLQDYSYTVQQIETEQDAIMQDFLDRHTAGVSLITAINSWTSREAFEFIVDYLYPTNRIFKQRYSQFQSYDSPSETVVEYTGLSSTTYVSQDTYRNVFLQDDTIKKGKLISATDTIEFINKVLTYNANCELLYNYGCRNVKKLDAYYMTGNSSIASQDTLELAYGEYVLKRGYKYEIRWDVGNNRKDEPTLEATPGPWTYSVAVTGEKLYEKQLLVQNPSVVIEKVHGDVNPTVIYMDNVKYEEFYRQTYEKGDDVEYPEDKKPTIENYEFTEWEPESITNIQNSQIVYAKYVAIRLYVTALHNYYIYDGTAKEFYIETNLDGTGKQVMIEYSLDNVNWSTTRISRTDECNITVYYRASSPDYTTLTGSSPFIITQPSIRVVVNNADYGQVQIDGGDWGTDVSKVITSIPTTVILNTKSNSGYEFSYWSDGVTTGSRSYEVQGSTTLTAYFGGGNCSITRNLTNCTSNSDQTSVAIGGAWQEAITADDGYTLETLTATMEGGGEIGVYEGQVYTSNVTGNITITATATKTPTPSTDYSITRNLTGCTSNKTDTSVAKDTKNWMETLKPFDDYTMKSISCTVGGSTGGVTISDNVITIGTVSGDVVINATATGGGEFETIEHTNGGQTTDKEIPAGTYRVTLVGGGGAKASRVDKTTSGYFYGTAGGGSGAFYQGTFTVTQAEKITLKAGTSGQKSLFLRQSKDTTYTVQAGSGSDGEVSWSVWGGQTGSGGSGGAVNSTKNITNTTSKKGHSGECKLNQIYGYKACDGGDYTSDDYQYGHGHEYGSTNYTYYGYAKLEKIS